MRWVFLTILIISCANIQRRFYSPSKPELEILNKTTIKVHMKSGEVYVLKSWNVSDNKTLEGYGKFYSVDRKNSSEGNFSIPIDSIAIIEANFVPSPSINPLSMLLIPLAVEIAIGTYCLSNPKACFGSCPTFYVQDGDSMKLKAEGFSSSIAPALEADDIDALVGLKSMNGEIEIEMRNEAWETHVVRYVDLLIVPRNGKSVFFSEDGKFYRVNNHILPKRVECPQEKDKCDLILNMDGKEWFSLADDKDLGSREEIELEFDIEGGKNYALVVGRRQTLLPTFLFYQTLAYMGDNVGELISKLARNEKAQSKLKNLVDKITSIEIFVRDGKGWKRVGVIHGEGPLAIDYTLLPIGEIKENNLRVKLVMTKGAVRIDYISLVELGEEVEPIRIKPYAVIYQGKESDSALSLLLSENDYLVTLPGDVYKIKYRVPEGDHEFFLKARGYYLEWMRKEWMKEKNMAMFWEIILRPEIALRKLAPVYKRMEGQMEDLFWRSKYAKP